MKVSYLFQSWGVNVIFEFRSEPDSDRTVGIKFNWCVDAEDEEIGIEIEMEILDLCFGSMLYYVDQFHSKFSCRLSG